MGERLEVEEKSGDGVQCAPGLTWYTDEKEKDMGLPRTVWDDQGTWGWTILYKIRKEEGKRHKPTPLCLIIFSGGRGKG